MNEHKKFFKIRTQHRSMIKKSGSWCIFRIDFWLYHLLNVKQLTSIYLSLHVLSCKMKIIIELFSKVVCLLNKDLLSIYYVPGSVQGSGRYFRKHR